jgi:hypothetical protein
MQPRQRSRYDWLLTRLPMVQSSSSGKVKNFLLHAQPTSCPMVGALSPGCKADHSPPTTAEVKKIRICTSALP